MVDARPAHAFDEDQAGAPPPSENGNVADSGHRTSIDHPAGGSSWNRCTKPCFTRHARTVPYSAPCARTTVTSTTAAAACARCASTAAADSTRWSTTKSFRAKSTRSKRNRCFIFCRVPALIRSRPWAAICAAASARTGRSPSGRRSSCRKTWNRAVFRSPLSPCARKSKRSKIGWWGSMSRRSKSSKGRLRRAASRWPTRIPSRRFSTNSPTTRRCSPGPGD